ncbi:MAG: PqqD family protein [Anaerolineae bacterium]
MRKSIPTRVTKSTNTLFQEVGGEGVLLNLDTERYYVLDDVGMRMWQVLAEGGDVPAALEALLAEYEVDRQTLFQDLVRLIGELEEAGLLVVEWAES